MHNVVSLLCVVGMSFMKYYTLKGKSLQVHYGLMQLFARKVRNTLGYFLRKPTRNFMEKCQKHRNAPLCNTRVLNIMFDEDLQYTSYSVP